MILPMVKCGSSVAPVEFVLESEVSQAAQIIPRLRILWGERESAIEQD